jgi:hypothetical protein
MIFFAIWSYLFGQNLLSMALSPLKSTYIYISYVFMIMEGLVRSWRGHSITIHLIGFAAMLLVKWGCWDTPSRISHQNTALLVPFSSCKSKSMLLVCLSKRAPGDHELRLLQQFFDCHGEFQKIVAAVASRREFRRWLVPGVTFSRFEIFRLWARSTVRLMWLETFPPTAIRDGNSDRDYLGSKQTSNLLPSRLTSVGLC